jgi:hypothetical protein
MEKEIIGNYEDNIICTLLDPRFKLINFNGSTVEMKGDAKKYLKETIRQIGAFKQGPLRATSSSPNTKYYRRQYFGASTNNYSFHIT